MPPVDYLCNQKMASLILLIVYIAISAATDPELYMSQREELLHNEALMALGGSINLDSKEEAVNNCLMQRKFEEADLGFTHPEFMNFSQHYFMYKDLIPNSKVYQIIKKMPKGAALHVHDLALHSPDYLLNITYKDNLYVCFEDDAPKMIFADILPKKSCSSKWQLMSTARSNAQNITEFDADLRKHFTIVTYDPVEMNQNINEIWVRFSQYFKNVIPILTYRPVWEEYFYDALKIFRDDGVMYIEVRSLLPSLYELNGTTHDAITTAETYKKAINRFVKDYPDHLGAKVIYSPVRLVNKETCSNYIKIAKAVKQAVPDIFAGFDLVGREDLGQPLVEFIPELLSGKDDLDFFFHAGETNWYGTTTDENLVDAILLGAKRLGHAYALPKHPLLITEVRKRGIALEVNVISNVVLALVRDARNHPMATFIAKGLPIVISSDDPGPWEAEPLSHDYYVVFQGVASREADLRLLKALALNSIRHSALGSSEKISGMVKFLEKWNQFITNFICL